MEHTLKDSPFTGVFVLQPLHVVCPEQYTQPPPTQSHRADLMLELQPPPVPYRRCSVLNLPFRRRYERVYILPEVSCCTAVNDSDEYIQVDYDWRARWSSVELFQ